MSLKKTLIPLLAAGVLAASVSNPALAGGRGNGAAIAAGILGAVVVGSLLANSQPAYAAPQPQPYYPPQAYPSYEVAPAYYPPAPVQQIYYAPPQPYYAPPAIVIEGRYRDRHDYRGYRQHDRDGYYSR